MVGVIYLGRIPHGFYESEIKSYFSQFGTVLRVHIPRNIKTGRFKHYAFVEFQDSSVAQIAQETMDNYLLMDHQLVCKMVKDPKDLFKSKKFKKINWVKKEAEIRKSKTLSVEEKRERISARRIEKNALLKSLGIEYSF